MIPIVVQICIIVGVLMGVIVIDKWIGRDQQPRSRLPSNRTPGSNP